jgi:sugar/nucleoside kinase (ribokinase family)
MTEEGQRLEIICVGNALVDIFVETDEVLIKRFGFTKSCHIEYGKVLEILKYFPNYKAGSGGGAANVAKIASLLGVKTGFIGAVGRSDKFADIFERDLSEAGAELFLSKREKPTGACVFLRREGEPDIIAAAPSAAYLLDADDIPEYSVKTARVVVVDGFIMERDALVNRIFELAAEHGTIIALDVGSIEMAKICASDIMRYCKEYPLILFMNQDEAQEFFRTFNGESGADEE